MIHPQMATMLAFLTTDAPIAPSVLGHAAPDGRAHLQPGNRGRRHVDERHGLRARQRRPAGGRSSAAPLDAFAEGVEAVCRALAVAIAADGEGARAPSRSPSLGALRRRGPRGGSDGRGARPWSRQQSTAPIRTGGASRLPRARRRGPRLGAPADLHRRHRGLRRGAGRVRRERRAARCRARLSALTVDLGRDGAGWRGAATCQPSTWRSTASTRHERPPVTIKLGGVAGAHAGRRSPSWPARRAGWAIVHGGGNEVATGHAGWASSRDPSTGSA